jgi:hypothetical protein
MRIPKLHPAWAMPVLALAVTLFVVGGVVDVLLMIFVGAALVGMYLLRRYARAELLYQRLADGRRPASRSQFSGELERNRRPSGGDTGRCPGMRVETATPCGSPRTAQG